MGKVYERPRLQVATIELGAYGDYDNGLPEEGLGERFGLRR